MLHLLKANGHVAWNMLPLAYCIIIVACAIPSTKSV